jgi:hypothetical protein
MARDVSPRTGTRVVCYCDDCQTFARYLEKETATLDERGGTDIFQLAPAQIEITSGVEQLRSMRLQPKGLIRWYAGCCKTPIGNTVSGDVPVVGLIHNFIEGESDTLQERLRNRDQKLGPIRFYIHGKFAKETSATGQKGQKIHDGVPPRMLMRVISKLLLAKLRGQGQPSPFFDDRGVPVSMPKIL